MTSDPETSPSNRALLILHTTSARLRELPEGTEILRYIQGEMRYFRERGRVIIFALPPHARDLRASPLASDVVSDLTPRAHEHLLATHAPSAFFNTALDRFLRSEKIARLTLVGVDAAKEVLLTAADAMARGYRVVVPEPCVASGTEADRDTALHFINEVWVEEREEQTHPAFINDPSDFKS